MSQGEQGNTKPSVHSPATSQLAAPTGGSCSMMGNKACGSNLPGPRNNGDLKGKPVKRFKSGRKSDENPPGRHEVRFSARGEREEPFSTHQNRLSAYDKKNEESFSRHEGHFSTCDKVKKEPFLKHESRFLACDKENGESMSTRQIRSSSCDKKPFSRHENRFSACTKMEPLSRPESRFSACCDKDNEESFSRREVRFLACDKENEEKTFSRGEVGFSACYEENEESFLRHRNRFSACDKDNEEPFSRREVIFVAFDKDKGESVSRHQNNFSACAKANEEPFPKHQAHFPPYDGDNEESFSRDEIRFSACHEDNKEQFYRSEMILSGDESVIQPDDGVVRTDDGAVETDDGVIRPGMPESDQDVTMMGGNLWRDDILPPPSDLSWRESNQVKEDDGVIEPDDGVIETNGGVIDTDDGVIRSDDVIIEPDEGVFEPDDGVIRPGMPETDQDVAMMEGSLWRDDILPPFSDSSWRESSQALPASREIETPALTPQLDRLQTEMSITATACLESLLSYTKACVDRGEPLSTVRARAVKTFRERPPLCMVEAMVVMETVDVFEGVSAMHLTDMVERLDDPQRRSELGNQLLLEEVVDAL